MAPMERTTARSPKRAAKKWHATKSVIMTTWESGLKRSRPKLRRRRKKGSDCSALLFMEDLLFEHLIFHLAVMPRVHGNGFAEHHRINRHAVFFHDAFDLGCQAGFLGRVAHVARIRRHDHAYAALAEYGIGQAQKGAFDNKGKFLERNLGAHREYERRAPPYHVVHPPHQPQVPFGVDACKVARTVPDRPALVADLGTCEGLFVVHIVAAHMFAAHHKFPHGADLNLKAFPVFLR